jgi:very-short-patch-repair endonuclease
MRNTKNYKSLPYNPNLRERSKELRKAGILCEVLLWRQLKNKQLNDLDFDRQKIIGDYIVDFYCSEKSIVIEVDGSTHNKKIEYDKRRDEFLKSLGLEVIHIFAVDILNNLEEVINFLENHPALKRTPPKEGK